MPNTLKALLGPSYLCQFIHFSNKFEFLKVKNNRCVERHTLIACFRFLYSFRFKHSGLALFFEIDYEYSK